MNKSTEELEKQKIKLFIDPDIDSDNSSKLSKKSDKARPVKILKDLAHKKQRTVPAVKPQTPLDTIREE